MALIDKLIKTIYRYNAGELVLAPGEKVTLTIGESRRPVSAEAATRQQIEVLLREITPSHLVPTVRVDGSHEFPYASPSGSVQVHVERSQGSLRIRAVPVVFETEAEPSPASAASVTSDSESPSPAIPVPPGSATVAFRALDLQGPGAGAGARGAAPAEGSMVATDAADSPAVAPVSAFSAIRLDEPLETAVRPDAPAAEPDRPAVPAIPDGLRPPEFGSGPSATGVAAAAPVEVPDSATPPVTEAMGSLSDSRTTIPAVSGTEAGPDLSKCAQAMEELFMKMVQEGCSDLHLCTGNPPLFRKDGEILPLGADGVLTEGEVRNLVFSITPRLKRDEFEARHDTDFAHEVPGVARFRCNLFLDRQGVGGVFRQIPTRIPTAEDLGLSRHILQLCELSKGLVLVTGPTGSGKSTTLAALVDHINRHRTAHIITIEDPIEFVHPNQKCLINQREVGTHTEGFKEALRAALREDPDCILVGEMRDLETIAIAIETAETGHLVFGTLHTNTAPSTVDRMIDQFPADRQSQVRAMLSESLKGVISQTLCKKRGGGRVAALEVLFVTAAVSNLIREGKAFQIPSIMQTGKGLGMATLNDALMELVQKGTVSPKEAYFKSVAKAEMKTLLERNSFKIDAA